MRSSGAPTATVLIVITLVFAPVLGHNHWFQLLVGHSATKVEVQCQGTAKCPPVGLVVEPVSADDASPDSVDAATGQSVQQGIADFVSKHGGP
jgi:cytolysin (calcineurin-like family phosphatase)